MAASIRRPITRATCPACDRSEEHTSELQSRLHLVCRLLLEKKKTRRQFVKGGMATFTPTFAAPEFISDLALAQCANVSNLVVLYLNVVKDSLTNLLPRHNQS